MKHLLLTTIAAVVLTTTAFAGPIHSAASNNDLAGVQAELDKGVDVNVKDRSLQGWTPLHLAAYRGHKEIVELLITAGADLNAKEKRRGMTPLHHAAYYGPKEIVELLIAAGADVNAQDGTHRWTPLHHAALGDRRDFAELLIAADADVNALIGGETPLDYAEGETADLLRKHGAKTGAELSILEAASKGNIEAVKQHLAVGADVNAKNRYGSTPLHRAAYAGHKEIAELLIAEGADVNAKTNNGQTPLDLTTDPNNQNDTAETAELLREHGGKTGEELKAMMPQLGFIRSPFGFTFNTIEGKTYRVESGMDLIKWNSLRDILGTGSEVKFIDVRRIYFPYHFYRVKVVD